MRLSILAVWLDRIVFVDLLVAVVFAVLAFGTVEPWSLALFQLNALLVAVLLALRFVIEPRFAWRRLRPALPLLALLALAVAQLIPWRSHAAPFGSPTWSLDPYATREAAVKLLALALYFIAALLTVRDSGRRRTVFVTLAAFGFVVSVFAIINRLTYNGMMYWVRPVSPYTAPYGPYGNYNHFAGFAELILPLPLAYLLLARVSVEQRIFAFFAAVLLAVAVVFSLSRGGMLAIGVEILALALSAWRAQRNGQSVSSSPGNNRYVLLAVVAAIVVFALWIGADRLTTRFHLTMQGTQEYSLVTRSEFWRASWRMFLDHPLAGVGLGAFPAVYPTYGRSTAAYERLEQAHNDYLQLLTDAGLIGGLLALWFLFELIRIARRQIAARLRTEDRALTIGAYVATLGLGVHSFLDFNLQIAANALLFLLVVALAVSETGARPNSSSRSDG